MILLRLGKGLCSGGRSTKATNGVGVTGMGTNGSGGEGGPERVPPAAAYQWQRLRRPRMVRKVPANRVVEGRQEYNTGSACRTATGFPRARLALNRTDQSSRLGPTSAHRSISESSARGWSEALLGGRGDLALTRLERQGLVRAARVGHGRHRINGHSLASLVLSAEALPACDWTSRPGPMSSERVHVAWAKRARYGIETNVTA
jgi:hypothetical protein